ncbi:MAG: hypothetical protein JW940_01540 [Polyangiaceae bacterium]|nr:hypothetical protein [Polyangiaceae bacterium]
MISADSLRERRRAAKKADDPGAAQTERLKARLARARDKRVPFSLTRDEFLEICRWSLGDGYRRSAGLLESNSEKRVKRVTQLAFAVKDPEAEFALAARLTILRLLPGVGMGVASAILALCWPRRYAPIDGRVWSAFFDEQRSSFELPDYRRFLARANELADEVRSLDRKGHWSPQLVAYYTAMKVESSA